MATSDSRFKSFKFNSHSKPPPLPPKDSIYIGHNNPSISSIDIPPNSPSSPLSTTNPSTPPSDRQHTKKDKALAFLKFPKRSPRSPSANGSGEGSIIIIGNDDLENPPPPEPDSQISTPWNFQHNIHVNEGYIGLPPSWSTSLASVGFTPEEIANLQARRAAGSLAPPDLRYLYTERPTTPMAPGFQSAFLPSSAVPIVPIPASRTTSLPLKEPAWPPISSITRRPPPKRRPPLPMEEASQNGHKPNQLSSSTTHLSSDSHQSNPATSSSHNGQSAASSGANNSTPYRYPYPSTSTSNLSSRSGHSSIDDDGQTPARAPLRLGPSNSNDTLPRSIPEQIDSGPSIRFLRTNANAPSEFGVTRKSEEGESEDKPRTDDRTMIPKPIWGTKRTIIPVTGKLSNPSMSSLVPSAKSPSFFSTTPLYLQQQQSSQSAPNSSSFVATASSSLSSTLKVAAASTSLSIAAVVRSTKGVIRRGLGTSKDNDDSEDVRDSEDEDLEIDATSGADGADGLLVPAGQGGRRAVWQLYTRPRTSTDASSKPLDVSQQQPANNANTPGGGGGKPYIPFSRSQGSLKSLTKQKLINKGSSSQVSFDTQGSASQISLNSVSAIAGSGLGTGDVRFLKQHQKSGSITSLESIPEVEGPVGLFSHPYAMAPNADSSSNTTSSNTASSSSFVTALIKPVALPAIRPPRLSLHHQNKGSLDISMWSEALLSGISRSAELDLEFTFSGNEQETAGGNGKGKERDGDDEEVMENEMGVKETEKGKDEQEPDSTLATARPFGYPTQNTNVGATHHPTKARYPVPARPAIINNNASSTSIPVDGSPPYPTGSHSKECSSTSLISPLPAMSPFSPPANVVAHPHHHHGYGQSPKPPPAVPLPPPPPSVPAATTSNNANNTSTSASMALRGFLSPPPTPAVHPAAAGMLSPPPSAYPPSFKSPTSSTGPDSAQLWSEIETMMGPGAGLIRENLTGAGVGLPPGGAKGSVTAGGAGGRSVLVQGQVQPSRFAGATLQLDTSIHNMGITTDIVGGFVGSSPAPPALTAGFSPILPFSPEEERMAATRTLRAGEGILGTKTNNQEGERKNAEEREDDGGDSGYADVRDLDEGSDYSDQEELVVQISKAPGITDSLPIPDNHVKQRRELLPARDPANRHSSHSSSSTLTAETIAVATTATAIVGHVSTAKRAGAVVLKGSSHINPALLAPASSGSSIRSRGSPPPPGVPADSKQHPPSPLSSNFGNSSEESAGSLSHSPSPSSLSQDTYPTPTTDSGSLASPLMYYLDGTQTPSPLPEKMAFGPLPPLPPTTPQHSKKMHNGDSINDYDYNYSPSSDDEEPTVRFAYPDEATVEAVHASMAAVAVVPVPRPTIVISDEPHSDAVPTAASTNIGTAPLSPFQRYRGWLSDIVAPLEEFIDEAVDPRNHYLDLREIAEGESGSVFSARLNPLTASQLRLPHMIKAKDAEEMSQHPDQIKLVAIKSVAIVPSGSPKLVDLHRELTLMKGLLGHENVLGMDGVYVDLVEDSLWVRMELMERSLADMVGLVGDGLMLQDRMLARFASDVLSALEYLQRHHIAHRDVRSDNLLLNKHGFLKLADFSNAVQVTKDSPMRTDLAGVVFWQAPEVRKPPYNVLKVDVWSLGATVWEMAQTEPPFSDTNQLGDRWPPLRQPELYSPSFHDFLRKCSEPASSRPNPSDLLKHHFVHNACGRPVIVHLLSQCMAIEQSLQAGVDASP